MAADPYKYFRIEARELVDGLSRGALELEKAATGKDLVGRLLRLAHTLKGASRVVKASAIGDLAHAVEDVLAPYRDAAQPVPKGRISEILKLVDAIGERLSSLDPSAVQDTTRSDRVPVDDLFTTCRIEIGEMDALLHELNTASAAVFALRSELEAVDKIRGMADALVGEMGRCGIPASSGNQARADGRPLDLAGEVAEALVQMRRTVDARMDGLSSELFQVRDRVDRLRLVPASAVFASLERAVRDAAQALQKRVEFVPSGGEVNIDAHVLAALRDALIHVVRNSVAHGVELEPERATAGKPPVGRIELRVEPRGNRVGFICRDDGRGIDVGAVGKAAVERGRLSETAAERLSSEEAIRVILAGGVTTTGTVTVVSGRGVGLEAVRDTTARLKGEVSIYTAPGKGTTVEIYVPISLSSIPSISMDAGGVTACVPIDSVRLTIMLTESDVACGAELETILWDGKPIPFVPLADLLRVRRQPYAKSRYRSAVVISAGEEAVAVGVERVLGTERVVARPLPAWVESDPIVSGRAISPGGDPMLVLSPHEVVVAAQSQRSAPVAQVAPRPSVLVIDDSLTTRMLEQSILESSGYQVDTAASGEEALSKARQTRYCLFVVDIEMPGMDGFEFIRQTKSDPGLREVPAILVTSRTSSEDRRRGEEVGARAYIAKSEFDQGRLLTIIRELVG